MSSLVISGDTSGTVTLAAPAVAGSNTLTLLAATATSSVNTLATAVASTSGTSITFSSIPAWVKRITVMFQGVSTNSTNPIQVQIGSGSITTSGYNSSSSSLGSGVGTTSSTVGFVMYAVAAANTNSGQMIITTLGGNVWVASHSIKNATTSTCVGGGDVTLAGTLDQLRIVGSTTGSPTDTFDAGSVNILYEG